MSAEEGTGARGERVRGSEFEAYRPAGDLGRATARGGTLAVAAQIARLTLQLGVLAILARLLAPEDFGLVAMALVLTGFLAMFADLGLSTATMQRAEITEDVVSALFALNLVCGVGAMVALVLVGPFAGWAFDEPRLALVVAVLASGLPVLAAGRQHAALLQRGLRIGRIEAASLAAQAGAAAAAVALAFAGAGYWALVAQNLVATGLGTLFLWIACTWRPRRPRASPAVREAVGFGLRVAGFQVLNQVHRQTDDLLVGWRWGAAELGLYNRAYMLLTIPLQILTGPVSTAVLPALSRLRHRDRDAWLGLYATAIGSVMLIAAPAAMLLVIGAPQIVGLLLGPGWEGTAEIFGWLALSILAQPVMSSVGWLWISAGALRDMLRWAAMSIPLMVLAMLAGLPWGAVGVAAGYATSIVLLTPVCLLYAARGLGIAIAPVWRAVVPPILAALLAFALVRALGPPAVAADALAAAAVNAVLFATAYLGFTFAFDRTIIARTLGFARLLGRGAAGEGE